MKMPNPARLNHMLRWAQESSNNPAMAAADWLARDINASAPSAITLLTRRDVSLEHLKQAKDVFKTMRLVGETAADRRLGGRLYIAAIAAAVVVHNTRISRQSTSALIRALMLMTSDPEAQRPLKQLAHEALTKLAESFTPGQFERITAAVRKETARNGRKKKQSDHQSKDGSR